MLDWIGWVATAIFAASYFCKWPATLRWVQALGALLWVVYRGLIHALPVVVANLVVASVATTRLLPGLKPKPDLLRRQLDGFLAQ